MAKVSERIKREGEVLLSEENLVEFDRFIRKELKLIDHDRLMFTVQNFIDEGRTNRAILLWRNVVTDHDGVKIVFMGTVRMICRMLMTVGSIGGIVYIVEKIFMFW
jgi:hypothetical protein